MAQKTTMSGRELEAAVLTRVAQQLKECQDNWETVGQDQEELTKSLKYHQMVWSILQAELAKPDNLLPKKLREDILSLSAFMDKRIFEIMAFPSKEKLSIIIEINRSLAASLRTTPS
jgi:flagellar protein FlaF